MAGAASKRSRPAFSPPRPKKTNATHSGVTKSKNTAANKNETGRTQKRSRPSKSVSADSDASSEEAESSEAALPDQDQLDNSLDASPEPDFILAEVTHEEANSSTSASIPPDLLQLILHEHFQHTPKSKLAISAKQVISRYVDVFIREAIMRSNSERRGGEGAEDNEDNANAQVLSDQWLEVEHLEKVGAQMCLDF